MIFRMRKSKLDNLLTVAFIFVIFFLGAVILLPSVLKVCGVEATSRTGLLITAVYQSVFIFILPSILCGKLIYRNAVSALSLDRFPSVAAITGVIITFIIGLPFLNQIIFWNANISFPSSLETIGASLRQMEDNAQASGETMMNVDSILGLLVNILVIGIVTATGEEMFFRGTLQKAADFRGKTHTAIWVTALLFSAFHFQIFGFVPRLLLGAWFGYLLVWSRSLYLPIIAHAFNNGMVVVCTWLSANGSTVDFEKLGVTETGFPVPAFVSALLLMVFFRYYRRLFFGCKNKKTALT